MSDTVRDAVFGNVGSMISFRVSADDAPVLSKQFEPQFEAGDLLQMHNRHFIINMVINGEKAPAFSATTLKLPPEQIDNSAQIIENSRRLYSRPRADIEAEINALINTPAPLQPQVNKAASTNQDPNLPRTPAQAKLWPIDAGAKAVEALIEPPIASNAPSSLDAQPEAFGSEANPDAPAKKKRKRTRKRKKPAEAGEPAV